jgi:hypothetical protein
MSHSPPAGPPRNLIAVEALADCSFAIAAEYATEYMRNAEAGGPEASIRLPWSLPFPPLGRRVTLTFGLYEDVVEGGRPHDEMRFRWQSGTRWLPDFHGTLRLRIEELRTRVALEGSYAAPLGAPGRVFDRFAGRHIAHATLQEVANRIARYLSRSEDAWRAAHPAPAG